MGECYLVKSGGIPLNFTVVGGTSQPVSPKENTIWVNTDKDITGWAFSATEPSDLTEGMVWITTGISSAVEFNALKKNSIQVCPISAKQYVGGVWVDKVAKSYQGGSWQSWWNGELFVMGDEFTGATGGWIAMTDTVYTSSDIPMAPVVTTNSDNSVSLTNVNNSCGVFRPKNKIDLTRYSRLYFDGLIQHNDGDFNLLGIWTDFGTAYTDNLVARLDRSADSVRYIDVSGITGFHYLGFLVRNQWGKITMRRMWLE